MFVTAQQIQSGLIKYVSTDMLPKLDGWKKVLFGAALELIGTQKLAQQIMSSSYVSLLGITNSDGMIDLNKLKDAIEHQIGGTKIDIDVPVIGTYKICQADIERICQIIERTEMIDNA